MPLRSEEGAGTPFFQGDSCGGRPIHLTGKSRFELVTGVQGTVPAALGGVPGNHMMTHLMELAVGLVAAGLTTMMGFFATKLVIEGMARKLHG